MRKFCARDSSRANFSYTGLTGRLHLTAVRCVGTRWPSEYFVQRADIRTSEIASRGNAAMRRLNIRIAGKLMFPVALLALALVAVITLGLMVSGKIAASAQKAAAAQN